MRNVWHTLRDASVGVRKGVSTFAKATRPILRPFFPAFRVVIALLVLQIVVQSVYPLIYGVLTDALVDRDASLAILLFGVLVLQGLIHLGIAYGRDLYEIRHIDWVMNLRIMTESLERISSFSLAQSSRMHSGKSRDIVRKGRLAIRHLVYLSVYMFGPTLLRLILALGYLVWVSPLIGGVALVGTIVCLSYRMVLFVHHRKPMKELDDHDNENGKLFADTLANMEVVMAYARQKRTVDDFEADGKGLVGHAQGFWKRAAGLYFVGFGIAMVTKYAIMGLTAWLLFGEQYSFGTYVAITQWAMMAMNATEELGRMQREISTQWSHAENYLDLLNQEPEISSRIGALQPERLRGHVQFEDVTFSYDPRATDDPLKDNEGEPVVALKGVTFDIPSGQKIALVGESGAGKSTIAYALMRARDPETGSIRIDGTDLRDFDVNAIRRRIGYVPQHPRLFDNTLRYNLMFGLEDSNGEVRDDDLCELLDIVKLAHLADSSGLDRKLGEGGHTLSGGERQRLCIARALIKNPDVLIFDEATSSLDPVNEKKVQDAIDAVSGRTKLIIAHRYSTISDVDRILVFAKGELSADGTPEELLADCSYYRTLLEQQGIR